MFLIALFTYIPWNLPIGSKWIASEIISVIYSFTKSIELCNHTIICIQLQSCNFTKSIFVNKQSCAKVTTIQL